MIAITNLTKTFEDKTLFSDLNLTIEDGDFVVFSGPSGCGKTTLLNMIGAIEKIEKGTILVDGVDIKLKKNHLQYFRTKIGFLFQNFALVDNKTVKDNLKLIRKDCKTSLSIEEALRIVGLEDKLNKKVFTLSGGEQQRIALARLMLKKCDIILADEPTGSLDRNNAEIVMNNLKQLNQQGKTIILVTHDEELKRQGNRVVNLCAN
ncbi:ATP-binding cassette domain-containing protein [Paenibacillus sp. MMS18-CY102]|uniref:ATP-binding cassette domain-containing protein n=1 Tax=Paenibacillus sp. MMS18-CY102 TaxID=2682849 RepID=UPI0013661078|nr:ATP-binding cassette domain-containing protein [Paenibacillus sp. MMS18-CY102]MWC27097.1 ATP-binding cassette domain-containing protein [Paenibacillus sp. MMS18-CY102]